MTIIPRFTIIHILHMHFPMITLMNREFCYIIWMWYVMNFKVQFPPRNLLGWSIQILTNMKFSWSFRQILFIHTCPDLWHNITLFKFPLTDTNSFNSNTENLHSNISFDITFPFFSLKQKSIQKLQIVIFKQKDASMANYGPECNWCIYYCLVIKIATFKCLGSPHFVPAGLHTLFASYIKAKQWLE